MWLWNEFQQILSYPDGGAEALIRSYIQFLPNVFHLFRQSPTHDGGNSSIGQPPVFPNGDGESSSIQKFIRAHGLPAPGSVKTALKSLSDKQLIGHTPKGYFINDIFFGLWLKSGKA